MNVKQAKRFKKQTATHKAKFKQFSKLEWAKKFLHLYGLFNYGGFPFYA